VAGSLSVHSHETLGGPIPGGLSSTASGRRLCRSKRVCHKPLTDWPLAAGMPQPWDTAAVNFHTTFWLAASAAAPEKFHESFWLATAAAAPVIALAAVVLVPEWTRRGAEAAEAAVNAQSRARRAGISDDYDHRPERLAKMAQYVRMAAIVDVCLQAYVLGMSLASIQSQRNEGHPYWFISSTVGGLLLLAVASWTAGRFRAEWRELPREKGAGGRG
jgi:hypothetical protein